MKTIKWLLLIGLLADRSDAQVPLFVIKAHDGGDQFGHVVDGGHDVDGDGRDDFLVSAIGAGVQATGAVTVFSGSDGHVLHHLVGGALNDLFGISAAFAHDTNGDGVSDIIVAARKPGSGASYAHLYSGKDGSVLHSFAPLPEDGSFAPIESVDGLGDVNHDGHGDVAVLSLSNTEPGLQSLQVRSGLNGSLLYALTSSQTLGRSLCGVGDTNGDGVPDFVVGNEFHAIVITAPGSTHLVFVGAARLFSGSDGRLLREWYGNQRHDRFGAAVAAAGDVNADGYADVLVGARQWSANSDEPGYARVYSGFDGTVLFEWNGDAPGHDLGASASSVGDVDADGFPDVMLGDFDDDDFQRHGGSIRIHAGGDGSLLHQFSAGSGFLANQPGFGPVGTVAARAGDLTGDGRADVLIVRRLAQSGSVVAPESIWAIDGRCFSWRDTDATKPTSPPPTPPSLSACGVLSDGESVSVTLTGAPPVHARVPGSGDATDRRPALGRRARPRPRIAHRPNGIQFCGRTGDQRPSPRERAVRDRDLPASMGADTSDLVGI